MTYLQKTIKEEIERLNSRKAQLLTEFGLRQSTVCNQRCIINTYIFL